MLAVPAFAQETSDLVSSAELVDDADFEDDNISGRVWTANIETCRDLLDDDEELTFRWTLNQAYSDPDLRYAIKIERPEGDCDTTSAGRENEESCEFVTTNETVDNDTQFETDLRPSRILDFSGPDDCFTEIDGAYDVFLVLPRVGITDDDDSHEPDTIRFRLDTERPTPPPGQIEVVGGENRLDVDWEEATEADRYRIYASTTPFNSGDLPEVIQDATTATVTGTEGSITSGVSANQTFYVGVVSIDDSNNESPVSEVTVVTTQPTIDFWEAYIAAGGNETGGHCAQSSSMPSGIWFGVFVVGLVLFQRRREV
jgi:hypothetical protein